MALSLFLRVVSSTLDAESHSISLQSVQSDCTDDSRPFPSSGLTWADGVPLPGSINPTK